MISDTAGRKQGNAVYELFVKEVSDTGMVNFKWSFVYAKPSMEMVMGLLNPVCASTQFISKSGSSAPSVIWEVLSFKRIPRTGFKNSPP